MATRKRIISLSEGHAKLYITCQIIDILHDCANRYVVPRDVRYVANMIELWIAEINDLRDAREVSAINTFMRDIETSIVQDMMNGQKKSTVRAIAEMFAARYFATNYREMLEFANPAKYPIDAGVIVDACDASDARCDPRMNQHMRITWSVLYDNGARFVNCGATSRVVGQRAPNEDVSVWWEDARILDPSAIPNMNDSAKKSSVARLFDAYCAHLLPAVCGRANVRDNADHVEYTIKGTIPGFAAYIILAHRSAQVILSPEGARYIDFTLRYARHVTTHYMRAVARTDCAFLYTQFLIPFLQNIALQNGSAAPSEEQQKMLVRGMLFAYNIFAAKHWGDLGLVLDTKFYIPRTEYVRTHDRVLSIFCMIFQTKCVLMDETVTDGGMDNFHLIIPRMTATDMTTRDIRA